MFNINTYSALYFLYIFFKLWNFFCFNYYLKKKKKKNSKSPKKKILNKKIVTLEIKDGI